MTALWGGLVLQENRAAMARKAEITISVIVPAHNHGEYLLGCLKSVLGQFDPGVEVIVVNDGSTDNTSEVLSRFGRHITVIDQPCRGPGAARNAGAQIARGRDLIFLDADDRMFPFSIPAFRHVRNEHPEAGMIVGRYLSEYAPGKHHLSKDFPRYASRREAFAGFIRREFSIAHGAAVVAADRFAELQYPESFRNGEDIVLHALLLATGETVLVNEIPAVMVSDHPGRLRQSVEGLRQAVEPSVSALFDHPMLPPEFQRFRNEFAAMRRLSLARLALKSEQFREAEAAYRQAWRCSPRTATKWKHIRRWATAWWKGHIRRLEKKSSSPEAPESAKVESR